MDHEYWRDFGRNEWVIRVKEDLAAGRLDGPEGGSLGMPPIFRVPEHVREMNERAYKPEVVSVGPYHHGEKRLQAMEAHKRRALLHFLQRARRQYCSLEDLLRELGRRLQDIRGAYDNLDGKWINDEELFLIMMLMDGCFIIEILLAYSGSTVQDYRKDDPIFGHRGQLHINVPSIRRDLLLIENQIPLLVLRELFKASGGDMEGLVRILLKFLSDSRANVRSLHRIFSGDDQKQRLHILDLYRRVLIVDDEDVGSGSKLKTLNATKIPSAMALQDHGILMRRHSGPARFSRRNLLWKLLPADFGRPKLELPSLTVDGTTESVFLNAMVFESQRLEADARLTSYVYLMNGLIVYPKDAKLLSTQLGIIRNELGSDQTLVDLFRRLPSANFIPDSWFFELRTSIYEHCRS